MSPQIALLAVPLFFNILMPIALAVSSSNFNDSAFSVFLLYFCCITSFFAAMSSVFAYFEHKTSKIWVSVCIAANGIATILLFAAIYGKYGIIYAGPLEYVMETTCEPIQCIYFSTVTFTTLGYGDFQPSAAARPFAALEALIGYIYLGMIVGIFVNWGERSRKAQENAKDANPTL